MAGSFIPPGVNSYFLNKSFLRKVGKARFVSGFGLGCRESQ